MVSRSETARALLTPGEVMQLPPDDEIIMAAGLPPIRARKARYFLDPRLNMRVLEPPKPVHATIAKAATDDWSGLEPIQTEQLLQVLNANGPSAASEALTPTTPRASVKKRSTKSKADNQADTSGIRREPGLPEHENIAPEPDRPFNPFDPDADTSQDENAQNQRAIDRAMRRNARTASLDPDDGIEL